MIWLVPKAGRQFRGQKPRVYSGNVSKMRPDCEDSQVHVLRSLGIPYTKWEAFKGFCAEKWNDGIRIPEKHSRGYSKGSLEQGLTQRWVNEGIPKIKEGMVKASQPVSSDCKLYYSLPSILMSPMQEDQTSVARWFALASKMSLIIYRQTFQEADKAEALDRA